MSSNKKYLIVGAGLAGICVARHLQLRGVHVTLIDPSENKSSVIAAGMINPLVFRRMTKSWRVDEFLPYGEHFYRDMEKATGANFLHPIVIRRIFSSLQERGFWTDKQHLPDFSTYMETITEEDDHFNGGHNPFGTGRVKGSCFVEAEKFIHRSREFFMQNAEVINEAFDHAELDTAQLTYKKTTYSGIIFCEGYLGVNNPLFSGIPIQQTKGETLLIHCPDLKSAESLNRKCFVLPVGKDRYRVGATYVWNTPNDDITDEARNELREKFAVISDHSFEIEEQKAGIRPTTPDRRPVMGEHAEHKNIYIFNGLGTKGYMSAPLLAKELCDLILEGTPLHEEIIYSRFKKS